MRKEMVLSLDDLRFLTIKCRGCGTRVILDLTQQFKPRRGADGFAPKSCPACGTPYDSAVPSNVDTFQRVYLALSAAKDSISFQAAMPDEQG